MQRKIVFLIDFLVNHAITNVIRGLNSKKACTYPMHILSAEHSSNVNVTQVANDSDVFFFLKHICLYFIKFRKWFPQHMPWHAT